MVTAEQNPRQRKARISRERYLYCAKCHLGCWARVSSGGAKKFDTATKENDKAGQVIGALMILGGRICDLADGPAARFFG